MYHIKREPFLKWMRACYDAINTELFDERLPAIPIKVENLKRTNYDAEYRIIKKRNPRSPIVTHIVIGLHNTYFGDPDTICEPIFLMAHEMIHFYCDISNIKDIDSNGYHNELFLHAAESYGMYCREWNPEEGYSDVRLTWEQVDRILSRIPSEILDMVLKSMTVKSDLPYQLREYRNLIPKRLGV